MKQSLPEYLFFLSGNDYDILEEIFDFKYRKFIRFFWLIRDYSEYITSLSYKTSKKDSLKIEITITKLKPDKMMESLKKNIKDTDDILITNKGKLIKIEIRKEETEGA